MTHLANIINRLMLERPKLKAVDLARRTKIDQAKISRLRSGKDVASSEQVAAIALELGRNANERAEIVAAHLKDQSCGFYPELIQILIKGKPTIRTELDPDIEYLQSNLSDRNISQAVRGLASIHRYGNKHGNSR